MTSGLREGNPLRASARGRRAVSIRPRRSERSSLTSKNPRSIECGWQVEPGWQFKTGWQFRTGWQIISQPTPATPVPVTAQDFGTQKRVASLTHREGSGASWPRYRYSWGCYEQKDKRAVASFRKCSADLGLSTRVSPFERQNQYVKGALSMVSLAQAQAVQKLEAEGWMIVEPSNKRAKGGPVMMMRRLDGDAGSHFRHAEWRTQRATADGRANSRLVAVIGRPLSVSSCHSIPITSTVLPQLVSPVRNYRPRCGLILRPQSSPKSWIQLQVE